MRKRKAVKSKGLNAVLGWGSLILILALILLSVFKPEIVRSFLKLLGSGEIRLTSLTENFHISMDDVIRGILLPKGEDPTIMTLLKQWGVSLLGIVAIPILGSYISDKMYVSLAAGSFYAYLPVTAVVFLVIGIGVSHIYLTGSLVILGLTMLFAER